MSLETLRTTTKWLAAGAGTIAGLLVAGVPLAGIAGVLSTTQSGIRLVVAFVAVVIALFGAWLIIRRAAEVLAGSTTTFADVVRLDVAVRAQPQHRDDLGKFDYLEADPLLAQVCRMALHRSTDPQTPVVLADRLERARLDLAELEGDTLSDVAVRSGALRARIDLLEHRAGEVRDIAALLKARERFEAFKKTMPVAAALLVTAVVVFSLSVAAQPSEDRARVTEPTDVVVYGTASVHSELAGCDLEAGVRAVAVDGTWRNPVVAIGRDDSCGPALMKASDDMVVLPLLSSVATPAEK